MPKHSKHHKKPHIKPEVVKKPESEEGDIHININYIINISDNQIQIEQRAEGGGQINKDVGIKANQDGQNALDHSNSRNDQSNFTDGNGRSGIAGNDKDEAGGQQGIKVRDSLVNESNIISSSEQGEGGEPTDEDVVVDVVEENN